MTVIAANADQYIVRPGGTVTRTAANGLLANDTSTGTGLTVTGVATQPAHGTVSVAADGSFTYVGDPTAYQHYNNGADDPHNFVLIDSFTYTAIDASGGASTGTATISWFSSPPVTTPSMGSFNTAAPTYDYYDLGPANAITVPASQGLISTDASRLGLPLHVVAVSSPAFTWNSDGSFSYTGPGGSYNYTVSDGFETSFGEIRISPMDPNKMTGGSHHIGPGPDILIARPGQAFITNVFANDDPTGVYENDYTKSTSNDPGSSGSLTSSGSFSFSSTINSFPSKFIAGYDQGFIPIMGGGYALNIGTFINVLVTNDYGRDTADTYVVLQGGALNVGAAGGVLANDIDGDGDTLTVASFTQPAHGAVTVDPDGAFVYTPSANFSGADSFTYKATDPYTAAGILSAITVSVNVVASAAPVADISLAGVSGVNGSGQLYIDYTLANAGPDDSTGLKVTVAVPAGVTAYSSAAAQGAFNLTTGDWVVGSLTHGVSTTLRVFLSAPDGVAHTVTAEVTAQGQADPDSLPGNNVLSEDDYASVVVTAPPNHAPTNGNATITTREDGTHAFAAADFGFTDSDAGNSLQAVRIESVPSAGQLVFNGAPVAAGQVVMAAALGQLTFTPAANANGVGYASFLYSVSDGAAFAASPATLSLDVAAVNDPPSAVNAAATVGWGTTHAFTAAEFGFSDSDGNALVGVKFAIVPGSGLLSDNGVAVTPGQIVSAADIGAGKLIFIPGTEPDVYFGFQLQDDGGTANGGIDLDPTLHSFSLDRNGPDTMNGGAGHDVLKSGGGDDILIGGGGFDELTGGPGNDTFRYLAQSDSTSAAGAYDIIQDFQSGSDKISFAAIGPSAVGIVQVGNASFLFADTAAGQFQFGAIGIVQGSDLDTGTLPLTLVGDGGADTLIGGAGDDSIFGGAGADVIRGGPGGDVMAGGSGADRFVFAAGDSTASAFDVLTDFSSGSDTLDLRGTGYTAVGIATSGSATFVFASGSGLPLFALGSFTPVALSDVLTDGPAPAPAPIFDNTPTGHAEGLF